MCVGVRACVWHVWTAKQASLLVHVPFAMDVLQRHGANPELAQEVVMFLGSLSRHSALRVALVAHLPAVAAVLRVHAGSALVVAECLRVFGNVSAVQVRAGALVHRTCRRANPREPGGASTHGVCVRRHLDVFSAAARPPPPPPPPPFWSREAKP